VVYEKHGNMERGGAKADIKFPVTIEGRNDTGSAKKRGVYKCVGA